MSVMHNIQRQGALAVVAASLLGAAGCTVHTNDTPPPPPPQSVGYYESPAPAPVARRYDHPTTVWIRGHRADRVNAPPGGWRSAPHATYYGREAYWVGNRWYYRSADHGWVVFRDEPRELANWRTASVGPMRIDGYLADRTTRPRDVEKYPRVAYRGSYAYFIAGRWYYKTDAGQWVVFRDEPRELARRRIEMRRGSEYAYPRY